jgi:hypothetical protein
MSAGKLFSKEHSLDCTFAVKLIEAWACKYLMTSEAYGQVHFWHF